MRKIRSASMGHPSPAAAAPALSRRAGLQRALLACAALAGVGLGGCAALRNANSKRPTPLPSEVKCPRIASEKFRLTQSPKKLVGTAKLATPSFTSCKTSGSIQLT